MPPCYCSEHKYTVKGYAQAELIGRPCQPRRAGTGWWDAINWQTPPVFPVQTRKKLVFATRRGVCQFTEKVADPLPRSSGSRSR